MVSEENSSCQASVEDYDFWLTLEKNWRGSIPKFTIDNVAELFPACVDVVHSKLRELREYVRKERRRIKIVIQDIKANDDDELSRFASMEWLKLTTIADLAKAERSIKHLQSVKDAYLSKKFGVVRTPKGVTSEQITRAKQVPIVEVASTELNLRKSGANYREICPFHKEKTPSCYFFPSSNTFHCFGCRTGGDTIAFLRLTKGLSFIEAVRFLTT
jgi:hypothetical protein